MKRIVFLILAVSSTTATYAQRSVSAIWKHELSSTSLQTYKNGERLIISSIYTGTLGKDASQKYGLDVKVSAWDKPFTTTSASKDKKLMEVLTVTLSKMNNPKEMKAKFSDTVFENGQIKLRFSGQTILYRAS